MRYTVLFLLPFLLNSCFSSKDSNPSQTTPNIIYVLADDLGYGDLSIQGQKHFETPHIDQMAKEGIRLTHHYSGAPVCAPSRASLMTGLHTGHTYIRGNKEIQPEGQAPMPVETRTVAHTLKEAGYTTACVGKWGLGHPGSSSTPLKMGFDYFFGYNCQMKAHHYFPEYLWENDTQVFFPENKDGQKETYSHDLTTQKAFEFIKENKEKPFFLYIAYAIPHAELVLPEAYIAPFKGKYEEPNPFPDGRHYGAQSHPRAAHAAMISHLDSDIGRLNKLLKDLGLDENTLVIFTSDNGPHREGGADPDFFDSAAGLRGYKRDLYEGGIRVPFVAKWPKTIQAGRVSEHPSAFWDMLPTFCDIAKHPTPENLDGISFLPELLGKRQKKHDFLYWEFHGAGGDKQAVRKGKWKAVRTKIQEANTPIELYNLDKDPKEEHNIASEHPKVMKEMQRLFDEQHLKSDLFPFRYERD